MNDNLISDIRYRQSRQTLRNILHRILCCKLETSYVIHVQPFFFRPRDGSGHLALPPGPHLAIVGILLQKEMLWGEYSVNVK